MIEKVIEKSRDPKVVCHALYRMDDHLNEDDLQTIRHWREIFEQENYFCEKNYIDMPVMYQRTDGEMESKIRNVIYCMFLEAMVRSKFYKN